MKYPFLAYCENIDIQPIFKNLVGDPFVLDLSPGSTIFNEVDVLDQKAFQGWLETTMEGRFSWGLAAYLEDRQAVLSQYPQMQEESRYYHLGLDIIVDPATPLYAPLDGVVKESGYEEGNGNYGGNVLLMHESPYFETFYSLYGHLDRGELPRAGERFKAGEPFAFIGDFHENGNWFFHTHLQVITKKGYDLGWVSKGYCSARDLTVMDSICPCPLSLFRI